MIPVRRLRHSLVWILAFMERRRGRLEKVIDVVNWFGEPAVTITTDASPWGLGATLHVQGQLWAVICDGLHEADLKRFELERGDCRGQSLWEALAELVAIRTWAPLWRLTRTQLRVRGDSQAALGALGKLRFPSPHINAIARELAIDLAESSFELAVHQHIPGKSNVLPDFLSRLEEPGASKRPPCDLSKVHCTKVEPRGPSWWRTWAGPDVEKDVAGDDE